MYSKPSNTNNSAYKIKPRNQIGKRFSRIFNTLTDPSYYTGTKYGKNFNRLNDDGTSKIYVYDPLEEELKKIHYSQNNEFKFLVGLTGMGKTTLLRNYFKITDRDIKISDSDIIIYISFYYADLLSDNPQKSIEKEIVKYLLRTVKKLLIEHKEIYTNSEKFWSDFYNFIISNKPTLLENDKIIPNSSFFDDVFNPLSYDKIQEKLKKTCENNTLEYYSSLIKYILTKIQKAYNIFIIFDDIESKEEKFHKTTVELARHLHSCFSAIENPRITIKTIIALRAYTFRCNIGRQSQARRESIQHDTILKKNSVNLLDIFNKRFEEIEETQLTKVITKNIESYNQAKTQLYCVAKSLDRIGGHLIYNLSNYNLCDALLIYCNIMINLDWIAEDEAETSGAFQIDSKNYRITTENLMYVIANMEVDNYMEKSGYVPNILYNDKEGTDLIAVYIIKYLLINGIDNIYGEKYITGSELLQKIRDLFVKRNDSNIRYEYWTEQINSVLNYLYNTGILFRSLYDIEDPNDSQIERKYDENFKLYLSPRGKCLYTLLSKNAVLLELYRDDIYTDIPNNDKLTVELSTVDVFDYLLKFLQTCYNLEKNNIGCAIPNLELYQENVGNEYITSTLLEGVLKNISAYFKNKDDSYNNLIKKVFEIYNDMCNYSDSIYIKYNIRFNISTYISDFFNNTQ